MSSKLDQMRNEFRERLNLRPVTQTKIHVIRVENNNYNNNNNLNFDSKLPKSDNNLVKNSVTNPRKSLLINNEKSALDSFKDNERKSDKSHTFSGNLKIETSNKTNPNGKSNDWPKRANPSQELDTKSLNKLIERTDFRKPKDYLQNKFVSKSFTDKSSPKVSSEGTACRYCDRRFALSERLQKHESVCISSIDKSRQKFDSSTQRFKGQPKEYLEIYEKALNSSPKETPKASNWRRKHEYCIATIKASKGDTSSGPTTSQIMALLQTQCHYCKRRFNDVAIKRHLPICSRLYHKNFERNMKF